MPAPTVYKQVTYVGKGMGTLKLYDKELQFQMFDVNAANNTKIFTLPWGKVKRRQVTSSARDNTDKPKFKLVLKSGNEAVFQMEDRISLEVLRDDMGERLQTFKARNPDSDDDEAVNKTRSSAAPRRQSTPYRMAKPAAAVAPEHQPRQSQPYRMAKPAVVEGERKPQPYRMAKKEPAARRQSTPYRYAANK